MAEVYKISLYLDARWRDNLKQQAVDKGFRTINSYVNALIAKDREVETQPAAGFDLPTPPKA